MRLQYDCVIFWAKQV